jgi:hypothetical protein
MSRNMLIWKWSEDFDSPTKRKRHKLKFVDVTKAFAETGDHPAIGEADISKYLIKVFEHFGPESVELPFVVERYRKCVVFNYGTARFEVVPILGKLAMNMGLNSAEF